MKDWFVNPQTGFTYTIKTISSESTKSIKSTESQKEDTLTIEIKGSFEDETTEDFDYFVEIPTTAFNEKVKDNKKPKSSGKIKRNLEYKAATWKLYDSATYKNVNDTSVLNLNKDLTHFSDDDSSLTYEDEATYRIKSGTKRLVKLSRGLSRKGYKIVGVAEKENGTVNLSSIKYSVDLEGLKKGFVIPEGSDVELYVVWGKDDTKYWKSYDSITITKDEILTANSTLKMHDGTTDMPDGYSQTVDFIALPGGKISGTTESPKYFMWPVDSHFAKTGLDVDETPENTEEIYNDFVIADIPLTGGLYAIVKKWADDNGYKFSSGSGFALVTVGGADASGNDRLSAEDPSTICNWEDAIIFANAFTGWYNEKHPNANLSYAYTNVDGSPYKSESKIKFCVNRYF